jgi:glutamyl-tRNA synthetase
MENQHGIRVRFAPSPTGHLHLGGLRAVIFNWLFARHHQGKFLLRIEDTDRTRSKQEYTDSILSSLQWLAIDYDEELVIQSERLPEHTAVINSLLAQGKAYACFCSAQDADEHHDDEQTMHRKYDGTCRELKPTAQELEKPHAIRFKIPESISTISFDDLIRGNITFERDQLDDFIIARSDGTPMYNFVVVVDDAFMKITHVIRGEEHISNTPKQILLYQACGYTLPAFAHLPLILGSDGKKLSKRDAATAVLDYKKMGYLPDALFNYMVRLGWAHGDQEIFTRQELIQFFSLDAVGKKGAIFDLVKLAWVNTVYMRNTSGQGLLELIERDVEPNFRKRTAQLSNQALLSLIDLYKERVQTVAELATILENLCLPPATFPQAELQQWINPTTAHHLEQFLQKLDAMDTFTVETVSGLIKTFCKELNIKLVTLAQPIRIALTGTSASPSVFELMVILGKDESRRRLKQLHTSIAP